MLELLCHPCKRRLTAWRALLGIINFPRNWYLTTRCGHLLIVYAQECRRSGRAPVQLVPFRLRPFEGHPISRHQNSRMIDVCVWGGKGEGGSQVVFGETCEHMYALLVKWPAPASRRSEQQAPATSTAAPEPLHTPQASSRPAQHCPFRSRVTPSPAAASQQAPTSLTTPVPGEPRAAGSCS